MIDHFGLLAPFYDRFIGPLLFIGLVLLWRRRTFPGQIFVIYLVLYGLARFVLEFFRGDPDRGFIPGTPLSTSQGIYLVLIAAAVVTWTVLRRPTGAPGRAAPAEGK